MRLRDDKKTLYTVVAVCALSVLIFAALAVSLIIFAGKENKTAEPEKKPFSEIHGLWVASVYNLNFPSKADLSAEELKAQADGVIETAKKAGLNAIFYQVRPSADALYKSDIYPVSKYLSSDGTLISDTLEYLTEAAHKENIAVHAWINPLRATVENGEAAFHPEWCILYADGKYYYDCGLPEVRETVAAGVREIVENYDVDGVVFDDYFYPYPTEENGIQAVFDDGATYEKYGKDFETKGDFRRNNVNTLIKLVYDTVKETEEKCLFGVAPFGIWKNGTGKEDGSLTAGMQSYYDIYCDTVAWVKGGYVDYIAPQIYWRDDEPAAPYNILCDWWSDVIEGTEVKLMVSHAAYRYSQWDSPGGTMKYQVSYAKEKQNYGGGIFYGYAEIASDTAGISTELREIYGE